MRAKDSAINSTVGLVLEGGGHRGIYTAGVLDVFLENGIKFGNVIGVSAGTIHGASYVAEQIGRSVRYTEKYCTSKDYMGWGSYIKTGDLFNVDFCYRMIPQYLDPFDNDTFDKAETGYYVVCTDVEKGTPVYKKCETLRDDMVDWILASASMPVVAKIKTIDGMKLMDGGLVDSIPLKASEELGFSKNVVILTQPEGYVKKSNKLLPLIKMIYKDYPNFIEAVKNRHKIYNSQLEYLEQQVIAEKAFVIRPSSKPVAGRTEKDPAKIRLTYELGRQDAIKALNDVKCFLNPDY